MEKKPHFFQFILPGFHRLLTIPISFLSNLDEENRHGGEAILKTSYDVGSWRVKVVNGRDFGDGWEEFAQAHNLHVGDLLVFRYEGGLDFHVKVFDLSASEKQYSHQAAPLNENGGGTRTKIIKNENSIQNQIDISSSSDTDQPQHVRRSSVELKDTFSFTVEIQPYNFSTSSMNIPIAFARSNGLAERKCIVTLKNEMGKCWQLSLTYKKSSGQVRVYMQSGWREFLDANKLRVGDVCTFKLLSTGENVVMEVTLETHKKLETCKKTQKRVTCSKDLDYISSTTLPVRRGIEEEAPSFTAEIKLYNFSQSCMNIPITFARSNGLLDKVCMITLKNMLGRCWQVVSRGKPCSGAVYIRSGWNEFSDDNKLSMGDICTFKRLSTEKNVMMEVTITRHKKDKGSSSMTGKSVNSKNLESSSQAAAPLLIKNAEEAPYFTVKLQDHHRYGMNVPMNFARSNGLLNRTCTITLKNGVGKCWQLNMRHKKSSHIVIISWREFSDANKLSTGDVCTFKLLSNGKKVVMEVRKHRKEQHGNKAKKRRNSEDLDSSRTATSPLLEKAKKAPHFTVKIQPYNFSLAIMHILIDFARSNGLTDRTSKIVLLDKRGIRWQASLVYKKNYQNNSSQVCIRDGWREFAAANKLMIGDVCTFKLISSGKTVVMEGSGPVNNIEMAPSLE